MPHDLRDARPDDRPAIVALWVAAWAQAMPQIDFAKRRRWFVTYLDDLEAAGARTIVAERNGTTAGFMTIDTGRATIDQIAVAPEWQGAGIASTLIAAAKRLAPAGLELIVNRDNGAARRFYAAHGFEETGVGINPTSGLATLTLHWTPVAPRSADFRQD